MADYINPNIQIIYENDFYKIISKNFIKKNTIILIESPKIYLLNNTKTNEDKLLNMLFLIIKNRDTDYIKNLYPRTIIKNPMTNNNPYYINIIKLIQTSTNKTIKDYLLSFDKNIIYQHYYKYLFNAFEMNKEPVILPLGALMNHSHNPNIEFTDDNNKMYFRTKCDIKPNEELCYSYLRNYKYKSEKDKNDYLYNHYNIKLISIE